MFDLVELSLIHHFPNREVHFGVVDEHFVY